MSDELPDFGNQKAVAAWLERQPREAVVAFAARAALRVLPLLADALRDPPERSEADIALPVFRAMASPWLGHFLISQGEAADECASRASRAAARAARTADAPAARGARSTYRAAAHAADANAARAVARVAAQAAAQTPPSAVPRASRAALAADAAALADPERRESAATARLWPEGVPERFSAAWRQLKGHLLSHEEKRWDVWTDWYEARLHGDPPDWELERARVLDLDDFWEQGPKAVNEEIARRIEDAVADRPGGETLDVLPDTGRIGTRPAEVEDPEAVANAVAKVEDAVADFRASNLGNRVPELTPVLRKLDRALTRYRDDPRRLHDDFESAARTTQRIIRDDPELDEPPVHEIRDACADGALDIRISVKKVADMVADRLRRRARKPSAESRAAVSRLIAETGEGLEPPLSEEIEEDRATLDAAAVEDGKPLPEGDAREAHLRLANRLAWLRRFSRLNEAQIAAVADRVGRSVDEVERLVTLLRGFEEWSEIFSLIFRSV